MPIENVSDTALWVAWHRAQESLRPDALFQDPLSGLLAGERGREIAHHMPGKKIMAWIMALRTSAIDRLIVDAVALGADTVLNIGAGLDTRPYRMQLPPTLRCIEVDLPAIIGYKSDMLRDVQPNCRLERIAMDLSHEEERAALLERVGRESDNVLVITEGVIPYLTNDAAASLAAALHAVPAMRYWIQDYHNGNMRRNLPLPWHQKLQAAPFRFDAEDWLGFFATLGWRVKEKITTSEESERTGRGFPFVFPGTLRLWLRFLFMPPEARLRMRDISGYVLLERADATPNVHS